MKFQQSLSFLLFTVTVEAVLEPARITFDSLLQAHDVLSNKLLLNQLQQVGMIAISHVPNLEKSNIMKDFTTCMESEEGVGTVLPDGTLRRTLASTWVEGQPQFFSVALESCQALNQPPVLEFRKTIGTVVEAFGAKLANALGLEQYNLLLSKSTKEALTLHDIVHEGLQLEHFHAYYHEQEISEEATLDWHIDQGLFLIFTPGTVNGIPTQGFLVQLEDGSIESVEFGCHDDLVIFVGDGLNQIVNPVLNRETRPLRPLPHALRMPQTQPHAPRTWYGRMVLPPPDALHPTYEMTFGEIRDGMMQADEENDARMVIGCSSLSMVARDLSDATCDQELAAYCWHSCMNYTDYNVSPDTCAQRNLELACVNDDGFLWPDTVHDPQFALGCANLSVAVLYSEPSPSPVALESTSTPTVHDHNQHQHSGTGQPTNGDSGASTSFLYMSSMFVSLVLCVMVL